MAHVTVGPCLNLHMAFFSSRNRAKGILSTLMVGLVTRQREHSWPLLRSQSQCIGLSLSSSDSGGRHFGQNTLSGWLHSHTGRSDNGQREAAV